MSGSPAPSSSTAAAAACGRCGSTTASCLRGNLALSLKLDGLFSGPERPVEFPRACYADPDGVDTFYLDAGAGDPVVLLHGLGATNASLLPTLFDLAPDHRVVAPDLPGFGDTAKPIRSTTQRSSPDGRSR